MSDQPQTSTSSTDSSEITVISSENVTPPYSPLPKPDVFKRKEISYNYNFDLATSKNLTVFKMIFQWKGSLWRAVYKEVLGWLLFYTIISVCYRYWMSKDQKDLLERFGDYCDSRLKYLPLNFVLGFFCNIIVQRWMGMCDNYATIDNIALFVSAFVRGTDERSREIRRNIVRYCVLSQTLVFRDIHVAVRRRFPTLQSIAQAGLMLPHELEKFESVKSRYSKYWLSFNWALDLLNVAKAEKMIDGDSTRNAIAQEIGKFRSMLSTVATHDWIPIPLMYPQLVNMAVHTFFFICLVARQYYISDEAHNKSQIDLAVPFMTTIELIFYMGWLKVAMELLNPLGDDAADFDYNLLIDRNLAIGLTSVDDAHDTHPELIPDVFMGRQAKPLDADDQRTIKFHLGSTAKMEEITEEELDKKEENRLKLNFLKKIWHRIKRKTETRTRRFETCFSEASYFE